MNFLKINQSLLLKIILLSSLLLSIYFIYYYFKIDLITGFSDAASRLDISRKITDNLTPGIGQIGNIWLPLPQILMLPLVTNDFLWHSGLAGSLVSGSAFILTVLFIYKTVNIITDSKLALLIASLVALTNVNLLYMQVAPMSEMVFISAISGGMYFLVNWGKFSRTSSLIFGAVFISAATFTRYEGYALLLASILYVILVSLIKNHNRSKIEGTIILYATVAVTGFLAWTIYLWVIFGNPFYWVGIYGHTLSTISTDEVSRRSSSAVLTQIPQKGNFINSVYSFWLAVAYMNGILLTVLSTISFSILLVYLFIKKRFIEKPYLFGLLLPLSVFAFVAFSLFTGSIPINQPELNMNTLLSKSSNLFNEYNIRYGLTLFPFVAVMIGWFASKYRSAQLVALIVILLQVVTLITPNYFFIYQLPTKLIDSRSKMSRSDEVIAGDWLKQNYTGGLIMISALKHDPTMFRLGFDYKTYIHEGTGKYWLTSRKSPDKYATWIYMYKSSSDVGSDEDSVTKYLAGKRILQEKFDKVYENKAVEIYKIKMPPHNI